MAFAGSWSPAVNNSQTTTYTFTPNSGQCATTTTMTVDGESKPDAEFCTGRSDLFGRQFFAANHFQQRHYRNLGAGGKQHSRQPLIPSRPNSGQCATSTATMTVVVNPNVTPSFAQIAPICSGGSFSLPTTSRQWHHRDLGAGGK
jgi:hypothetical protein